MKFPTKPVCAALVMTLALAPISACTSSGNGNAQQDNAPTAQSEQNQSAISVTTIVTKHEKFDAAVLEISPEDFDATGFSFGDSCDISFSNGYTLTDVPYFNGYYVQKGSPVIVAYPNSGSVNIAINNNDMWTPAGLADGDTVTITMNTPGKYLTTYEALAQSYSTDRADYATDEQFCNFRALSGGNLKENFLYRGATPLDNSRNRAAVCDALLEQAGITDVIDLADSEAEVQKYFADASFASNYTKSLYGEGRVALLSMSSNYDATSYKTSLATGMRHLIEYGGPAYIHCTEGKDRTGFVCMLLEALAGASYDEMLSDYMKTYENYFGITEEGDPERYDAIASLYFSDFMKCLYGTDDVSELKSADFTDSAKSYLTDCGMTNEEIEQLVAVISK